MRARTNAHRTDKSEASKWNLYPPHPSTKHCKRIEQGRKKHSLTLALLISWHLEIVPETRTEGPKQSIFRTVDFEVFALRSMWNQHRCVSWRAAISFGSPSVWCWPWTTVHRSLLPGIAFGSCSPSLSPLTFLPSLISFSLALPTQHLHSDRGSFSCKLQNVQDPFSL